MGNMWSAAGARHDIYIHQFANPHVTERSAKVHVRLVPRFSHDKSRLSLVPVAPDKNPFAALVNPKKPHQQAVVLSAQLLYMVNEFDKQPLEIEIRHFLPRARANEEQTRPEDTGVLRLECAAGFSGEIKSEQERDVYTAHPLVPREIKAYAGMESAILESPSKPLTDDAEAHDVIFDANSPLILFISKYSEELEISAGDLHKFQSEDAPPRTFYRVRPEFLARVRTFFQHTIFNHIHYTRFEQTELECALSVETQDALRITLDKLGKFPELLEQLPSVYFVLELNYLLVTPDVNNRVGLKHSETKLI